MWRGDGAKRLQLLVFVLLLLLLLPVFLLFILGVILGYSRVCIGVIWNNGKENGNYCDLLLLFYYYDYKAGGGPCCKTVGSYWLCGDVTKANNVFCSSLG